MKWYEWYGILHRKKETNKNIWLFIFDFSENLMSTLDVPSFIANGWACVSFLTESVSKEQIKT